MFFILYLEKIMFIWYNIIYADICVCILNNKTINLNINAK